MRVAQAGAGGGAAIAAVALCAVASHGGDGAAGVGWEYRNQQGCAKECDDQDAPQEMKAMTPGE